MHPNADLRALDQALLGDGDEGHRVIVVLPKIDVVRLIAFRIAGDPHIAGHD